MIDLTRYDAILVQSSADKDSAAQLDVVARTAQDAGVLDRVTVFHAELPGVEWPGVVELAATQAPYCGVGFVARRQFRGCSTSSTGADTFLRPMPDIAVLSALSVPR